MNGLNLLSSELETGCLRLEEMADTRHLQGRLNIITQGKDGQKNGPRNGTNSVHFIILFVYPPNIRAP